MNERPGRPKDGGWEDDRLAAAYRSLAARPAPADLTRTTIAAAEATPRVGLRWGWAGGAWPRPRFAAAGGLVRSKPAVSAMVQYTSIEYRQ